MLARKLFDNAENKVVDFQKPFENEHLISKADIFVEDTESGETHLYEVKSTSKKEKEHLEDIAFQKVAAEDAAIKIDRTYLIHLNSEYRRQGDLDIENLFTKVDVTDEVNAILPQTRNNIDAAFRLLSGEPETFGLEGYCKGKKLDCEFIRHHYPDLPDYTVFDISRLHATKLAKLLENGVIDIADVPQDFQLSDNQRRQVNIAQSGEPHIAHDEIKEILDGLEYPLYFLDYETLNHAIPLYDGYKPFDQVTFQYSLHIQFEPDGEIDHRVFLANGKKDPALELAISLQNDIDRDGGTVIVWYQSFEKGRNAEIGELYPEFAPFFESINKRVFDLMTIFSKGYYDHPAFKGSSSIKNVLPVLVPDLSYKGMAISHGGVALARWFQMAHGTVSEKEQQLIATDLLEYCHLDTWAMVRIFNFLKTSYL